MEQSLNELSKENAQSFHKIDFENTRIAFSTKTDKELKDMYRLFSLMNSNFFVKAGSKLGLFALKLKLPFVESIIRATIFKQFCGGVNLLDCQGTIDELYRNDSLTILDYGAEGKSEEHELDAVMEETMRAIEFAASNNSVPVVSTKLTGMVANKILRKLNAKEELNEGENREYQMLLDRINKVAKKAFDLKVGLFVDAEESWLQDPIDDIVMDLMSKFNREKVIIYNTYQLYRKDKLEDLKQHHSLAKEEGFMLGAKLVRGAYMEKERNRAKELGYPSPIHETKMIQIKILMQGSNIVLEITKRLRLVVHLIMY